MSNEEFIKLIKAKGNIKPLEDAFKDFPVDEEWHKGKIENVLMEDEEKYYINYEPGDIVFVREYKYQNGEIGSNHLFVIIGKDNIVVPIEYFGMLISSKINKIKYNKNKLIMKDDTNNLRVDSIVKTDQIYQIDGRNILFKVGKVDKDKLEEYKKSYLDN